ncbi:MAG TPA: 4-hydroxy-3-methylbut-2-enyl diphosphate reductase [Spirochaetota bacterium]|nr:4-hydroxy-3-methylbut-2-enyl diphosphate reductase [Spirochaetota bacterium]
MKIELSKYSGFCMGVRDAILRIVNEINSSKEEIYVHGPIIHNPQTISILDRRGLKTIDENSRTDGKTVAVRTHGIPYEKLKKIKHESKRLINLTCPRVARVQGIIKKYSRNGYYTLITGDDDHAEVISLKSYAASGVSVISNIDNIDSIPEAEKYIVVSQTTFDRELFEIIIQKLTDKLTDRVEVFNTICNSTYHRQGDVVDAIQRNIDILVVVGGKNSANTKRLANLGKEYGVKTFHIETEDELNESEFSKNDYVFVTAGASTPGWIINNVLEKLYTVQFKKSNILTKSLKKFFEFIVRTNVLSSVTAFFTTLFVLNFISAPADFNLALVASLYIFSMYTINNYFMLGTLKESNPYKLALYKRYKLILIPLSLFFIVSSMYLMSRYTLSAMLLYTASLFLGIMYSTSIFKRIVDILHVPFFSKMYNAKNITAAFGWLVVCGVLPVYLYGSDILLTTAVLLFIYCIIFFRNTLQDLIALQGDLILGRETVPILIGIKTTRTLFLFLSISSALIFSTASLIQSHYLDLLFILNILYYLGLMVKISRLDYLIALKYEFLVDLNLILFIIFYSVSSSF